MGVKPSVKSVKLVPTLCLLALVSLCIQSFLFLQSAASQPSQVRVPRQGTVKQHASAGHAHSHSRTLSPIPQTIHQIYKTTHASGWGSRAQFIQSWIERNPSFRHAVVDDEAALKFLDKHFSTEEKVLDAYRRFPLTVLRTDLLRYLLVYIHGGLYADADTICEQPIGDAFTNWTRNHTNVSFIGALEWFRDPMHKEQHTTQIAQWAFAAAPRHPALRTLIDEIVERTLAAPLEFLANQSHVLELTGPTPFSRHLTDYLLRNGDILDQTIALATTSTSTVSWPTQSGGMGSHCPILMPLCRINLQGHGLTGGGIRQKGNLVFKN
ncbi:nucleotide-diphospho-sugar transferase [Chytriomyces sp. MP71]|nr:nucleotide-diphospho-sugar transferase [Chytriomyces sp. MP71]